MVLKRYLQVLHEGTYLNYVINTTDNEKKTHVNTLPLSVDCKVMNRPGKKQKQLFQHMFLTRQDKFYMSTAKRKW